MNMAIDRQVFIDMLFGGYGIMNNWPIDATLPESVYTPIEKLPDPVSEMYVYDPDKARQLLADAGYPDGFPCEIVIKAEPLQIDVMSLVKDYWDEVGIDLTIKTVDSATFKGSIQTAHEHENLAGWFDSSPTPSSDLLFAFCEGRKRNMAHYYDPVFEDLVDNFNRALTVEEQNAYLKEASIVAISSAASFSLPGYNIFRFAWPWVKNYEGETMSAYKTTIGFHSILWLDQAMKAEMGY